MYLAGEAGVIDINGTVIVELITFLIMLAILARWVYPEIVRLAEARQRAVAEELAAAEKARADAQAKLDEAQEKLEESRRMAQGLIDSAGKSAEQLRQERREKAEEESRRIVQAAQQEIEAERERAVRSVRDSVADLVVSATEKVIGETLDKRKHRELIERSIEEVAGGDGRR